MNYLKVFLLLIVTSVAPYLRAQPGTLDPAFSQDGIVSTDFGSSTFDRANAIAIQDDGAIVVVGTSGYSKSLDFGVARYLPDGVVDNSFSSNGLNITSVNFGDDHATCVAIQDDGKILVGGYGQCSEGNCFALVRYGTDGALDTDFGTGGMLTTETTGGNTLEAKVIAVQEDGKILLAGGGYAGFAVVRYLPDGTMDDDFGTGGLATCAFGQGIDRANGLAITGDGKILLSGYSAAEEGDSIAITRLESDGTIDPEFGIAGRAKAAITGRRTIGQGMALAADGSIVVVGYSVQPFGIDPSAIVARFTADGDLDPSFNGTGLRSLTSAGAEPAMVNAAVVQPDGKIVLCGWRTNVTNDILVMRLNADGADDQTFAGTGTVITDVTGTGDRANAITLQADGRIILVGETNAGQQDYNFVIARYLNDIPSAINEPLGTRPSLHAPNPFSSGSVVHFHLAAEDVVQLDLYDARGALAQRIMGPRHMAAGAHTMTVVAPDLEAGLYWLALRGREGARTVGVMIE